MGCVSLSSSFGLSCISGAVGLKAVSFAPWSESTILPSTNGEVQSLTASIPSVYRYKLKSTGNTYVETGTLDPETRTRVYNGVLSLVLQGIDLNKRNELKMLGLGEILVFIEDNNGKVFVAGNTYGALLADMAATVGTGYALTINTAETDPMLFLGTSSIATYKTKFAPEVGS